MILGVLKTELFLDVRMLTYKTDSATMITITKW